MSDNKQEQSDSALLAKIEEALKNVEDPELNLNIVDLGLVYDLTFDENNTLIISMTLTSAACPLTDVLEDQIQANLYNLVKDYKINWVWMPPWTVDRITDEGKEFLRAMGLNL